MYVGAVNLAGGQRFTQVRPLLIEVKTYFLLLYYCFVLDLDYRNPAPTTQEPATSLSGSRVSLYWWSLCDSLWLSFDLSI